MVDGDDLFNRGYSILTRSMPVQPLDKVEVLQNYSNNKHLKGIEDSNGVALNLTVQEEFKDMWFGDATAGYGTGNRYKASGNLMNFGKKYKNFFTFDLNNAGYDRVGNVEGMFYNSREMETVGQGSRVIMAMSLGSRAPRLDESRTRFNDSEMVTTSSILPIGKKAKLKLTGFLGFNELYAYQDSYSVTDFNGTFFENRESNNSKNDIKKGYLGAYFNYDVSSTQMLEVGSTFNAGATDFRNDLNFNGISTREQLETQSAYFDQKLTYTHKWKERNVVLIKGRFFTDKLPQDYAINDYLLGDLFPYDSINSISNDVKSTKQYAGLQADFKLKQKNNDLIEFNIGFDNNSDNLKTRFSLFTDAGIVNPEEFQSDATYNVGDLYAESGYKINFGDVALSARVNAHQLFNRFENKEGETIRQNPFFVNPFLTFAWQLKGNNVLSARYGYNYTNAGLLQVNDAYILTSSRTFTKGLGYFNQLENSTAGIDYTTKHYLNRYSFSWGIDYSRQNDIISYRSELDRNSSLSEAFVMRGGSRLGGRYSSHYVVRKLSSIVKLDAGAARVIYYNQLNDSGLRKNTLYSQNATFGWSSTFKSAFNFNFSTEWSFSQVESGNNTFKNSAKYSFLDLMYTVTESFNIKVKGEHYNFGGMDSYNNYFFADLEASYGFKKEKYTIGFDARNLFNTDVFTTYSVSDIGYSTNSYRLLPRYVLLTFKIRF